MHKETNYLEWKPADTEKYHSWRFQILKLSDAKKKPVKFQSMKELPETEYRTKRFVKESDIIEIKNNWNLELKG